MRHQTTGGGSPTLWHSFRAGRALQNRRATEQRGIRTCSAYLVSPKAPAGCGINTPQLDDGDCFFLERQMWKVGCFLGGLDGLASLGSPCDGGDNGISSCASSSRLRCCPPRRPDALEELTWALSSPPYHARHPTPPPCRPFRGRRRLKDRDSSVPPRGQVQRSREPQVPRPRPRPGVTPPSGRLWNCAP